MGMKLIGDIFTGSIWGFSTVSLVFDLNVSGITAIIQLIVITAGLIYLLFVKFPNDIKMNRMNQKNKRLQNQALEKEIEEYNEGIEETDKNE